MDTELKEAVKAMAAGDEQGFNTVYGQTYNHVYFRAKQYMKDEEDALDLVQIVYVEAFRNISGLKEPEALYGWLDGITYRQGMKLFRKKKEVLFTEEAEGLLETLESEDSDTSPELTVEQQENCRIIREIIEELPELQKVAVIAFYYDNYSVGEIASMQECSEGTVKSRLNYARKFIKDKVEEREKKEGYRLHSFVFPLIYWAIKGIVADTGMPAGAVQAVYAASCAQVGVTAGTVTVLTAASAATASASAAGAAGTVATGAAVGSASTIGAATGLGAKFAALSLAAKIAVAAGGVAALGTAATGITIAVNKWMSPNPQTEVVQVFDGDNMNDESDSGQQGSAEDENGIGEGATIDQSVAGNSNEENSPEEGAPDFETTGNETTSVEMAQTEFTHAELVQLASVYPMANDGPVLNTNDYVFYAKYYIMKALTYRNPVEPGMLPFDWNSTTVTPETVRRFWENGFGVTIPEDYDFVDELPDWLGGTITCDSEMTMDWTLEYDEPLSAEVVQRDDGIYEISIVCERRDIAEEDWSDSVTLVIEAELSGDNELFCGYRIRSLTVSHGF